MPTIDGSFDVPAPRQRVWDFLTDIPNLAPCIPGCERLEQTGNDTYQGTVRVKVGPISARFGGNMSVLERHAPERVAARLEGKDAGTASLLKVNATLSLEEQGPASTRVAYHADVDVLGKLGSYGWGLMRRKAEEHLATFGANVRQRLAEG